MLAGQNRLELKPNVVKTVDCIYTDNKHMLMFIACWEVG